VRKHGKDLRYCHAWGKWLVWDGTQWRQDNLSVVQRAKDAVLGMYKMASELSNQAERQELVTHAKASESSQRIEAMVKLARSEPGVGIEPDEMDCDPMLLNCRNGTIDLKTGELLPHRREDLITKCCPVGYDSKAECPVFEGFIEAIFAGDAALAAYARKLCGYFLTGVVSEQILPIFYGVGANGKSTFTNIILALLGQGYSMKASLALLMASKGDRHPTEIADLHGKRFVACNETEDGRRLAESLVKELTGGDRLRARRMREDFWEFEPTHKIILATNHKPEVRGTDHAMWRRLKLVPFGVVFAENDQDKRLPEKLLAELPGILAWCVQGCLTWQRDGLQHPDAVTDATSQYKAGEDLIQAFIGECCIVSQEVKAKSSDLYAAYREWCEHTGEYAITQRKFGVALTERGFQRYTNNGTWYQGLGLERKERNL